MKIIGLFHMWPGSRETGIVGHNAGSETSLHSWMRAMVARGHSVKVIADQSKVSYEVDGVSVNSPPWTGKESWMRDFAKDADILITHLDCTRQAMRLSLDVHKPLTHFVHNTAQLEFHNVTPNKAQLVVFNSEWVKDAQRFSQFGTQPIPWPGNSIVLHPTVEPDRYRVERGERITLINPTPGKGAHQFYKIARALPGREFLVVKSVYGEQIMPPSDVRNVKVMDHTPDIREALCQTKILLMPSDYESYGRIAVEAACCGIPTIANPTPGLLESLGNAGIFYDRDDIDGQVKEIERLMTDVDYYAERSALSLKLADSLDPESEFDRLEDALLATANDWKRKQEASVGKFWTSDKKYWLTTDGRAVDSKTPEAITLLVGRGGTLTEADAIKYGLMQQKMVSGPDENKMISAPDENKSRKKKVAA